MTIPNTLTDQAVCYVRSLVSADPRVPLSADDGMTEVINMDTVSTPVEGRSILLLDLADGTSIRLDVERYRREAVS